MEVVLTSIQKSTMGFRCRLLCALAAASAASTIWAGGSGLNVAVVINQNSANSIQLANAYCEQRCVPPQNVLRLTNQWSGGSVFCTVDEFQNELCGPLLNMLQGRNLTNQIQFVLLSMDLPYEVAGGNGLNSTTSALFYGFKPDGPPVAGDASCSLPDDSSNSYAFSELPFCESEPNTAPTNSFLAVMLTDTNLANAELILNRGVTSDSSFPTQTVYLAKTDDTARNVRYVEFDNAIFDTRIRGDYSMVRTNTDSTSFTNLLGLETGLNAFVVPANAFVPGAMADNLTSFGGFLLDPTGQTTLLAFLDAGAAGSYGTVVEPCNYTQKFPNPLNYFYQARGFSLAEAYYQSIQNPYQGVMVGEPLSAPFALRGEGIWEQLPAGTVVLSGRTNLQLAFTSAAPSLPLNQVDLFVDGAWFETITNLPPAPGDVLSVTLNGLSNSYAVPSRATIASVASGLADVLNSASNSMLVSATAFGDRIELYSVDPALPGASVTLEASVTNGTASPATFLTPALPCFLDSIAIGYHYLLLSNAPAVGDWLELVVTKTNGNNVTLSVTNTTSGATIGQLLLALFNDVNGTAALQSYDGIYAADFDDYSGYGLAAADWTLYAQSPGWAASGIQVALTASPDLLALPSGTSPLQDNLSDLVPRNHLYVASGRLSLPVNWTLDTTQLQDGYHELMAVAYEGTSVRTQTRVSKNVRIQNSGLSASLNTLFGGANTDIGATLQFSVIANTNNVTAIELFSTGGSLGSASNQAAAFFSVAGTNLGLGLHPFYAIVTDGAGNQCRTGTTWIRLIGPEPPFAISFDCPPITLSWSCTAGRGYDVLMATNILGPFQIAATLTPSNSAGAWVDTNAYVAERFYRIETSY
jgi:uncharacterized protein (TIGR03790 family)